MRVVGFRTFYYIYIWPNPKLQTLKPQTAPGHLAHTLTRSWSTSLGRCKTAYQSGPEIDEQLKTASKPKIPTQNTKTLQNSTITLNPEPSNHKTQHRTPLNRSPKKFPHPTTQNPPLNPKHPLKNLCPQPRNPKTPTSYPKP